MEVKPNKPVSSTDLLRLIRDSALDPDYAQVHQKRRARKPKRAQLGIVLVSAALGIMTGSIGSTMVQLRPAAAIERDNLVSKVQDMDAEVNQLRDEVEIEQREVDQLRLKLLGTQASAYVEQLKQAQMAAGAVEVKGSGIILTIDDSISSKESGVKGYVIDVDLRRIVNGLWESGAEAISINGHRITSQTAIRGAGNSITVGYRSLERPYQIYAIGNPNSMPARFNETRGGAWLINLTSNYGIRANLEESQEIVIPAQSSLVLRHVKEN